MFFAFCIRYLFFYKLNISENEQEKNYNIKDFKFQHEINTRWKDLDAFGHVNNAVFLSYVEDARILFLKRWNINYKERSLIASAK